MSKPLWRRNAVAILAALAFLAVGGALFAAQLTGNIYGYVVDEQGGRLPGVTVTLTGPAGAPRIFTTDARGEYRFVSLPPGNYTLSFEIQGFTKVTKSDVQVAVGQNTNTSSTLRLSAVEATITVRGEAALLDTRKVSTGQNVSQVELKSIPTARDPWVILQTIPGVQTDRVNVGGNESGQQSLYIGKGADFGQNVWNVDGITITDTAALGSSGTYYDFESFEEIQAYTGGSDVTAATAGVQLNLVTKRGTNDVHGSARMFLTDQDWQSSTNLSDVAAEAKTQGFRGGNRIDEMQDYGIEVGGPIIPDRLWLWGAYGRNQIDLRAVTGASDKTTLENTNGKLNIQFFESLSGTASYTAGNKIKLGRNVSLTRPPETGWNQSGIDGNPSALYKGELSQVFSSKLFATVSHSYFDGGFQLVPAGGTSVNNVVLDGSGIWRNSYYIYKSYRPQHQTGGNGSFFFNTGAAGHELKFGFSYRTTPVKSLGSWPGNGNWGCLAPTCDDTKDMAVLTRAAVSTAGLEYYNAYLGDTITFGNLTINAGVRYDLQRGNNTAASSPANPVIPEVLPAIKGVDRPREFEWDDVVPRLGVTYAVGDRKKLILKGSYSRFADQLGIGTLFHTNANSLAGVYYFWNDVNKNRVIERGEIDFASGIQDRYGFDPNNPTAVISPNFIDPGLEAGQTDEIVLGADYEVLPEFVVGVNYTYRVYDGATRTRFFDRTTGRTLTPADYVLCTSAIRSACPADGFVTGTLADGTRYREPIHALRPGLTRPPGLILENRPDYETIYHGVDLNFQKRLSKKWMVRGSVGWQDWSQDAPLNSCTTPTNTLSGAFGAACPQGEEIMIFPVGTGSGAKGNVFINSTWQFNVAGLYELPLGFNIATNLYGREGYPYINWHFVNPGDGIGGRNVLIGNLDDRRHDDVFNFDLRLEKVVNVQRLQINLSADVFNVLNEGTVLQRSGRVNSALYNRITETQSPRVVRLGARISF